MIRQTGDGSSISLEVQINGPETASMAIREAVRTLRGPNRDDNLQQRHELNRYVSQRQRIPRQRELGGMEKGVMRLVGSGQPLEAAVQANDTSAVLEGSGNPSPNHSPHFRFPAGKPQDSVRTLYSLLTRKGFLLPSCSLVDLETELRKMSTLSQTEIDGVIVYAESLKY